MRHAHDAAGGKAGIAGRTHGGYMRAAICSSIKTFDPAMPFSARCSTFSSPLQNQHGDRRASGCVVSVQFYLYTQKINRRYEIELHSLHRTRPITWNAACAGAALLQQRKRNGDAHLGTWPSSSFSLPTGWVSSSCARPLPDQHLMDDFYSKTA